MLMLIKSDAFTKERRLQLMLLCRGHGGNLGECKGDSQAVTRTSNLTRWPIRNIDLNSA